MSDARFDVQQRARELRDGPAPWVYEDLFALIDTCARISRRVCALARMLWAARPATPGRVRSTR
jgi:hypothetical protein